MMRTPKCPACASKISILDIGERFVCPACQAPLRSSGKGKVIPFEIAAFVIFGFPLGFLISYGQYVMAVGLGLVWIGLEIAVRNAAVKLERDDGTRI